MGTAKRREALVLRNIGIGARGGSTSPRHRSSWSRSCGPRSRIRRRRGRRLRCAARSEPASGWLKPWHQRSRPSISPGRKRSLIASLPCVPMPWTEIAEAGAGRHGHHGELVVEDDVEHRREVVAAVPGRPTRSDTSPVPAGTDELCVAGAPPWLPVPKLDGISLQNQCHASLPSAAGCQVYPSDEVSTL